MVMKSIVILISGRGSNLEAILAAHQERGWKARISGVICNRDQAPGIDIARSYGIPVTILNHENYPDRAAFDEAMIASIDAHEPDLVILAGFMRILTDAFVEHYEGRLINIHPSLLPSFPGLNTHAKALEKGVKLHGATVHFVSSEMDAGPIIAQAVVPVLEGDSPQSLANRVLEVEHVLYVRAIEWFIEGRLRLESGIVSVFPPAKQFVLHSEISQESKD